MKTALNPPVFYSASAIIAALAVLGLVNPGALGAAAGRVQAAISSSMGWFYVLVVAGLLATCVYLAVSRHGALKLGPADAKPDYSFLTWVAMLFSSGMGIGLLFFSVAEPIQHYGAPPDMVPRTPEAARAAMSITFFHWGFHAWAIYAIAGLAMAYFAFRKGLPLTLKAAFCAMSGRKSEGWIGNTIDVLTICATLFGIATSLGLGIMQTTTGLHYLLGLPQSVSVGLAFIGGAIALTILSLMLGLDRGLRRLSEWNVVCAVALMLFVLLVGPTAYLASAFVENLGAYLADIPSRTLQVHVRSENDWFSRWTLFYWAWWISWAPFVGTFIARISRGRTIREFVAGVLLVPSLFCFMWMTFFGDTAIALDNGVADGRISAAVGGDVTVALFQFLEYFPASSLTSGLVVLLILLFFVTHADSGALVIDMIASHGSTKTPLWQRVYWCLCIGIVAALMLASGGLVAVQTATLVSALPFTFVLLFLAVGMVREVRRAEH